MYMSVTGFNSIISATLSGETDIICDNLTANTITLPSGDLQTTLDNIVAGTGETGPAGADGQSVSFYAPNITTLSAGSNATVNDVITVSSNTQYHQLTFNIPRGDQGEQGPQGEEGPQGDQGPQGPKGDDGDSTAATAAAIAAAASAAAAVGSAASASSSAAAAASSASTAATQAAEANATANAVDARTTHIDILGLTTYTTFNRNGGSGVDFLTTTDTLPRISISNNGTINQSVGTTTLNNLVVSGTMTGTLTGSASQAIATASVVDSDFPIPFLDNATGTVNILTDLQSTTLTYNPNRNILICPTFQGDLSGNATNSTNATKILATSSLNNENYNVPFLSTATGNVNILSDAFNELLYNPNTNTLTSVNFSGNLTGSASQVLATNSTADANYNIPFLSAATGNVDVLTDGLFGMTYNPTTNVLTAEKIAATTLQGTTINVGSSTTTINMEATNVVIGNTSVNSYIDIGNADYTDTINIESSTINIGVSSYLQTINIGSVLSTVVIRGITTDPIQIFNPIDQMNGIF